MKPNKVSNPRQPIVFDVRANATDEELDELALVVVAELDRQADGQTRAVDHCAGMKLEDMSPSLPSTRRATEVLDNLHPLCVQSPLGWRRDRLI